MAEPYSSGETARTYQSFHAFGFEIPLTTDGRRIWTPRFKRFVVAKMNNGTISVKQVEQECQVSKSQIYQWKMEAAGKPITARERRHCEHQTFTEIKVEHYEEVREKARPAICRLAPLRSSLCKPRSACCRCPPLIRFQRW